MATMKPRPSMRNVIAPSDTTGSLAGTMVPAAETSFLDQPAAAPAPGAYSPDDIVAQRANPQAQAQAKDYDAMDEHEPMSEDDWYQLLHNLGTAMHKANPDIQKVLGEMSPEIDYAGQAAELRKRIESRQTEKMPGLLQRTFAHAGSPESDRMMTEREDAIKKAEAQKTGDMDKLQENITMSHIADLQRRGKFQEALATMLLQKGIGEAGAKNRAAEKEQLEKLKGTNAINTAREKASAIADSFHFDERMKLKLLGIAGTIAAAKLQKYGALDPVMGGFTVKPEQYDQWQTETMIEIMKQAHDLQKGEIPATGAGKTPAAAKPNDPLHLRD